jgi:hypothetical protein
MSSLPLAFPEDQHLADRVVFDLLCHGVFLFVMSWEHVVNGQRLGVVSWSPIPCHH